MEQRYEKHRREENLRYSVLLYLCFPWILKAKMLACRYVFTEIMMTCFGCMHIYRDLYKHEPIIYGVQAIAGFLLDNY